MRRRWPGTSPGVGCASFPWVTSGRRLGLVRLLPTAVPHFPAADVQGARRRHRGRALLDPAHPRSLQPGAADLAARLRRAAPDVPALPPVRRVIRAVAVVLEVAG